MAKGKAKTKSAGAKSAGAKGAAKGPVAFKDWAYTPGPGQQDSEGAVQDFQKRKMAYDKYVRGFKPSAAAAPAKAAAPTKTPTPAPKKVAPTIPAPAKIAPAAPAAPAAPVAAGAAGGVAGPQPTTIKNAAGITKVNPARDPNARFNALAGMRTMSPFWKP